MINRKKLKYLFVIILVIFSSLFIALVSLLEFDYDSTKEREMVGSVLWLHAPDGSVGFEIINKNHPVYTINVFYAPNEIEYSGEMKFMDPNAPVLNIDDITGFDGSLLQVSPIYYLETIPN